MIGAMQLYPAALLRLLPPAVVTGAALWGRAYLPGLGGEARVILEYLPYLLCLVAVCMACQFNRARMLLAAVAVAAFYWAVQRDLQVSLAEAEAARAYLAFSLALPLLTLYLLLVPERGILNYRGLATGAGFVLLLLVATTLGPRLAEVNAAAAQYYAAWPAPGYVMSRGASLLAALVLLAGLVILTLRHEESDAALLGAFLAQYLALALLHLPQVSLAMGLAAALCVLWGVLRSSHAMAYRDELTGLPGRRALNERLKMLGRSYVIGMLDVDHFKRFNDTYGHDVGDQVLRLVASRIRTVRGGTAYRYGGEEFCVVFPRRTLEESAAALDAMRDEVANYRMSLRDRNLRPENRRQGSRRRGATRLGADQVSVTVSAGLAARDDEKPDPGSVIKSADAMLYKAKRAGRNRVAY
ncbi:MAG: GGDEF domain-containing protein [Halioglobus sp.]|nr:GGDEF domain-containing protein [Halioglobus sp.]